ncbi:MAG: hypothetical protein WCF85_14020 [Rhodospirillaceae bacterium]
MRKLLIIALVVAIGALSMAGSASAQSEPVAPTRTNGPLYPILLGVGAIGGVAVYNMASYGVAGVPLLSTPVTTGAMLTARAIAQNRVYTVVSAVVGAWVLNWLYGN